MTNVDDGYIGFIELGFKGLLPLLVGLENFNGVIDKLLDVTFERKGERGRWFRFEVAKGLDSREKGFRHVRGIDDSEG